MTDWKLIDANTPRNREILLAGRYDGIGQSGNWDFKIGQFLVNRFPFVGNRHPSHWAELPEPPTK